jgi:hypothetical protein
MRIPPADILASQPRPNYIDPETRGPAGKIVAALLMLLASIIVALRVFTRHYITKGLGLDDVLILLAYVMMIRPTLLDCYVS